MTAYRVIPSRLHAMVVEQGGRSGRVTVDPRPRPSPSIAHRGLHLPSLRAEFAEWTRLQAIGDTGGVARSIPMRSLTEGIATADQPAPTADALGSATSAPTVVEGARATPPAAR